MENKTSVLNYIDSLVAYAKGQGLRDDLLQDLVTPLKTAVTSYYSLNLYGTVNRCIEAVTHGSIRTGIVYTDGSKNTIGGTAPKGWTNVTEIFTDIDKNLMSTNKAAFVNSISLATTTDPTSVPTEYYTSNLVTSWISSYTEAVTSVPRDLNAIMSYGNSVGLADTVGSLLEPKEIKTLPNLKDIAYDVYITRKYLELIRAWDLGVYVPTSLGGV